MKLHFGHLLGLSALSIAGCAAFFSVYGISQLFAGAFFAVVIMASALEFGKLVAASYLQRYWKKIAVGMRIYVVTGVVVLVGVTSAGIYGFLSNAYQQTADALSVNDAKVKNITLKKNRYDEELNSYTVERAQLSATVNELSKGLANNVIQYTNKAGQLITTTSSSTRRALEEQLSDAKAQRDKITPKMDVLRDSVTSLELQILDLNINNEAGADIGPLRYISELLDISMDRVVNYFILLLIFVFDPLAIALVLATNKVFEDKRIEKEEKEKLEIKPLDLTLDKNTKQYIDNLAEIDKFTKEEMRKAVGVPEKYLGTEIEETPMPAYEGKYDKQDDVEYKQYELIDLGDKERLANPIVTTNDHIEIDGHSSGKAMETMNLYKNEVVLEEDDAVSDDDIQQASNILMEELMKEESVVEESVVEESVVEESVVEESVVEEPVVEEPVVEEPVVVPRPIIPQNERPVAQNGILKPASNFGRTTVTSDGPIKREDIKEIKENRGFIKQIPRRHGNI